MNFYKLGIVVIASILCLVAHPASAEPTQYICVSDNILGYKFNSMTHEWEPTKFTQTDKYLVRRYRVGETDPMRSPALKSATWGVFPIGDDTALASCYDAPEIMGARLSGLLMCDGMMGFSFNKKNLRFQANAEGHYIVTAEPESKGQDPWLELGRCSAL